MLYSVLATAVVAFHLAFILFVVGGALLLKRWPRVAWCHVPAALWGVFVELTDRVCPLTPLENWFRVRAGAAGYTESFLEHHLVAVVYPSGLTRGPQIAFGLFALAVNVVLYGVLIWKRRRGS